MRRQKGSALVPNEVRILGAAAVLFEPGPNRFHGYELLKKIAELEGGGPLMNNSTLYRSLRRLEALGLLESEWESEEEVAAARRETRPRRYYRLTPKGARCARTAIEDMAADRRPPWVPRIAKEMGIG